MGDAQDDDVRSYGYISGSGDVGGYATYNAPPDQQSSTDSFYHKFTYDPKLADPYKPVAIGDLGWKPDIVNQLSGYGISEIPAWMQVYGDPKRKRYETSDLAAGINRALNIDPYVWLNTAGKRSKAMHNVGLSERNGKLVYGLIQPTEWNDEYKAAAQQAYLNRLTRENHGGFGLSEMAGLGIALLPAAIAAGYFAAPAAAAGTAAAGAGESAAAGGIAGATAAGAGETAALGTGALSAGLPASVGTTAALGDAAAMAGAYGSMFGGLSPAVANAIAYGQAAGADVGMGSGTGILTDLGLPASYGADLGGLLGYAYDTIPGWLGEAVKSIDFGKLIGGGTNNLGGLIPGAIGITTQPTNIMTGSTSAPQTSPIPQVAPVGVTSSTAPATMPTGSIMGAFGNSDTKEPEYLKYFTSLF